MAYGSRGTSIVGLAAGCRPALVAGCAAALLTACQRDAPRAAPASAATVPARRLHEVTWTRVWQRGGADADTAVQFPFRLAADSARVYVLDAAARRVVALRASDGATVWLAGGEGGGPGEFREPSALTVTPAGEVAVADPANSRITLLDAATGALRGSVPAEGVPTVLSMCALPGGDLLLHTLGAPEPIVRMSAQGQIVERVPFPWPDLTRRPAVVMQGYLAPLPGGECVLALGVGRGFSVFRGRRFQAPAPYVERFDVPGVEVTRTAEGGRSEKLSERRVAALDVLASDGEIAVPFEGRTRDAARVVDLYSRRTGRYRETLRLPAPVDGLARAGPLWVALDMAGARVVAGRVDTAAIRHATGGAPE